MEAKNTKYILRYKIFFLMFCSIGTIFGFLLCRAISSREVVFIAFTLLIILIFLFPLSIWLGAGRKTSQVMSLIAGALIGIYLHSLITPVEEAELNKLLILTLAPTIVSFFLNSDPNFKGVMNV